MSNKAQKLVPWLMAMFAAAPLVGCTAGPQTPPAESRPASAPQATGVQAPQNLVRVTLAYSSPTAAQSLLWVANDAGLFRKYGLDAEIVSVATSEQIAGVIKGDIDVGITSADAISSAILEGADLVIVALYIPWLHGEFWVQPYISSPADLKGQAVGVTGAGAGVNRWGTYYVLRKYGLDPEKDVELRRFRNTAETFQAAAANQVAGLRLVPPDNLRAEKLGLRRMDETYKDRVFYPAASSYVSKSRIGSNRPAMLGYLKAMVEAIKLYKTDEKFTVDTFLKWTTIEDREVGQEAVRWQKESTPDVPKFSIDHAKVILEELASANPRAATLDASSVFDNGYLEELERTGFVDQVLKSK